MSSVYDLEKDFERMLKSFPNARAELLENAGDIMEDNVIRNISELGTKTGNLLKGVMRVSKKGYIAIKPNSAIAPHTHLLEHGFARAGKIKGKYAYAFGHHMYRNALMSSENALVDASNNMMDNLAKGFGK